MLVSVAKLLTLGLHLVSGADTCRKTAAFIVLVDNWRFDAVSTFFIDIQCNVSILVYQKYSMIAITFLQHLLIARIGVRNN